MQVGSQLVVQVCSQAFLNAGDLAHPPHALQKDDGNDTRGKQHGYPAQTMHMRSLLQVANIKLFGDFDAFFLQIMAARQLVQPLLCRKNFAVEVVTIRQRGNRSHGSVHWEIHLRWNTECHIAPFGKQFDFRSAKLRSLDRLKGVDERLDCNQADVATSLDRKSEHDDRANLINRTHPVFDQLHRIREIRLVCSFQDEAAGDSEPIGRGLGNQIAEIDGMIVDPLQWQAFTEIERDDRLFGNTWFTEVCQTLLALGRIHQIRHEAVNQVFQIPSKAVTQRGR